MIRMSVSVGGSPATCRLSVERVPQALSVNSDFPVVFKWDTKSVGFVFGVRVAKQQP